MNAQRTAIISAIVSLVAYFQPIITDGYEGMSSTDWVLAALGGISFALVAYMSAYQAIGLTEKLAVGTVVAVLGSVASGITAGLDPASIVVNTVLVVAGYLGVGYALPSTEGSVPVLRQGYGKY